MVTFKSAVVRIEFEEDSYTAVENGEFIVVCVVIQSVTGQIEVPVRFSATTQQGTAAGIKYSGNSPSRLCYRMEGNFSWGNIFII